MSKKVVPADREHALQLGYKDLPDVFNGLYMVKPGTKSNPTGEVYFLGRWAVCGNRGGMRFYPPKILKQNMHPVTGHPFVNLTGSDSKAHHWQVGRAVLMAKLDRLLHDGMLACHCDGNPLNNMERNLKEGTSHDNSEDAVRHGTAYIPRNENQNGSQNHAAKMDEKSVSELRYLYTTGKYTQSELGIIYDISIAAVSIIILRKRWKHVANIKPNSTVKMKLIGKANRLLGRKR